jgi:CRISPR-associated endonuclease Csn1
MKKNGNDARLGNYYVGLDVGTNSVGWAVTDENYCLKKCKGNGMWGVRLFDDAQKAEQRRTSRVARRRLARKKQRLMLLEILFAKEIAKVDPDFYLRMQESALREEDTSKGDKFSLFQDAAFTDREYHLRYPTAYHLRKELLESEEPHDVRLVYLAVHHIVKNRGHFLLDTMDDADGDVTLENALNDLAAFLQEEYELEFLPSDRPGFLAAMENRDLGVTAKKKAIKTAYGKAESSEELNLSAFLELLAGGSVKLASLFQDDALKDGEISSISLKNMENDAEQCSEILGDRFALVAKAKNLFDAAQLSQILNGKTYLSEAKVAQYEENKRDLKLLKGYVKKCIVDCKMKLDT